MTPKELKNVGQALFPGEHWVKKLAKALDVDKETVWQWAYDIIEIPGEKQHEIFDLVKVRLKAMKNLFERQLNE